MLLRSQIDLLNGKKVILASQSPRRQELLRTIIGLTNFKVVVSNFAEDLPKSQFATAAAYCEATVRAKAQDVMAMLAKEEGDSSWDVLICADTIVVDTSPSSSSASSFEILEKAADADEAFKMIKKLSGKTHEVITVLLLATNKNSGSKADTSATDSNASGDNTVSAAADGIDVIVHAERAVVTMAPLSDEHIRNYCANEAAWRGKAGAYGIQDAAACFIEGIAGDYYAVMGLPVHRLSAILAGIAANM